MIGSFKLNYEFIDLFTCSNIDSFTEDAMKGSTFER